MRRCGSEETYIVVIPAKAGIHFSSVVSVDTWIPAFAGMTIE
jgi:hypothetical protein